MIFDILQIMESKTNRKCHNCNQELPENAIYCSACGQKNTDGRIPLKHFVVTFLESIFNLDSRFFKTLQYLFVPGKLTQVYFEGKHKSYSHPLRLFFALAVLQMAIVGYVANKYIKLDSGWLTEMKNSMTKAETYELIEDFENENDEILNSEEVNSTIDSLKKYVWEKGQIEIDSSRVTPIPGFNRDSMKISQTLVKNIDLAKLSNEEIIEKYELDDFLSKVLLKQLVKLQEDPKSGILFALSNLIWMLFILLPATAFFMKLLYIRRKYFFVEHLVYLYHWHAVAFILVSIYLLFVFFIPSAYIALLAGIIGLFGFLALKRIYMQGWFKTWVKFVLILFIYFFSLMVLMTLTSLISLLVF